MVATKSGSIEVASMAPPIYDAAGIDCESKTTTGRY